MKFLLSLLIILITSQVCNAQILKRITNDIKNEAEHKIRSKTRQKVNQGIDSILAPSQKTEKKDGPAAFIVHKNRIVFCNVNPKPCLPSIYNWKWGQVYEEYRIDCLINL